MSIDVLETLWPQDFVVAWTRQVACSFHLMNDGAWVKKPFRLKKYSAWLRGPLLSYTDFMPDDRSAFLAEQERIKGTLRVFSLSLKDSASEEGLPVVMRLNIAKREENEIFKDSLSSGCRNRLRKSMKSGLEFHWIKQGSDISPAWHVLVNVHQRLGIPLFPKAFLDSLHSEGMARIGVVVSNGLAVAMLVLVVAGDIAWVPWCGALAEHHHYSPNHLSHWEAIKESLRLGCKVFDFGRSPYLGGTYEFKRKWGAVPVPIVEMTENGLRAASVGYRLARNFSVCWKNIPAPFSSRLGPHVFRLFAL